MLLLALYALNQVSWDEFACLVVSVSLFHRLEIDRKQSPALAQLALLSCVLAALLPGASAAILVLAGFYLVGLSNPGPKNLLALAMLWLPLLPLEYADALQGLGYAVSLWAPVTFLNRKQAPQAAGLVLSCVVAILVLAPTELSPWTRMVLIGSSLLMGVYYRFTLGFAAAILLYLQGHVFLSSTENLILLALLLSGSLGQLTALAFIALWFPSSMAIVPQISILGATLLASIYANRSHVHWDRSFLLVVGLAFFSRQHTWYVGDLRWTSAVGALAIVLIVLEYTRQKWGPSIWPPIIDLVDSSSTPHVIVDRGESLTAWNQGMTSLTQGYYRLMEKTYIYILCGSVILWFFSS